VVIIALSILRAFDETFLIPHDGRAETQSELAVGSGLHVVQFAQAQFAQFVKSTE
jgi:hypothetical protein